MNAAARLVHQHNLIRYLVMTHKLSKTQVLMVLLTMGIIISLLSIIYVTHANRILYASYQTSLAEYNQLQNERSQLLLEQSTNLVPAHIQQLAETKLGMITPDAKSMIIIHE